MGNKWKGIIVIDDLINTLQKAKDDGLKYITDISTDVRMNTYIYGGDRICGIGLWCDDRKSCVFVPFREYSEKIKSGSEIRKGNPYGKKVDTYFGGSMM